MNPHRLSTATCRTAGLLLLSLLGVEFGGYYLTRIVTGLEQTTPFQESFARAGHAHAGTLVILSLVCLLLIDAADLTGAVAWTARTCVPAAAVLMSAGFFASSAGPGRTEPNALIALVMIGAASLAIGLTTLAVGLLRNPENTISSPSSGALQERTRTTPRRTGP